MNTSPESERRFIDARLHLLDRQVHGRDGKPISTLDDLELVSHATGEVTIGDLLFGSALLARSTGATPPPSRFTRVPWSAVTDVSLVITVDCDTDSHDATWPGTWLRDHVIGRIPGARHDPQ